MCGTGSDGGPVRIPRRRAPFFILATVAAAVAALVAPAVSGTAGGNCTPGDWPAARVEIAEPVLSRVNAPRADGRAPPLVKTPTLSAASSWKARHMAMYGYMSHDDPAPPVARSTAD